MVVVWSSSSSSSLSSLGLQPVVNANRTLKNLKMIETRTKSLSKSTVRPSELDDSISFTVWVQWCKWEIMWACHLGAASLL